MEKGVQLELKGNVVICNAGLFRDFHPQADIIKEKHETGRLVSKAAHDERFLKIPETLSLVEFAELYDSLSTHEIFSLTIILLLKGYS